MPANFKELDRTGRCGREPSVCSFAQHGAQGDPATRELVSSVMKHWAILTLRGLCAYT